jgi:hypothetical protein
LTRAILSCSFLCAGVISCTQTEKHVCWHFICSFFCRTRVQVRSVYCTVYLMLSKVHKKFCFIDWKNVACLTNRTFINSRFTKWDRGASDSRKPSLGASDDLNLNRDHIITQSKCISSLFVQTFCVVACHTLSSVMVGAGIILK